MKNKKSIPERVRSPQQDRSKTKVKMVLAAARKCFVKFGYAKTTMSKIAKEAGVSTGTTYSYFADKNDVLKKIFEEHVESIFQPTEKLIDSLNKKSTLRKTLEKLVETALQSHEEVEMHRIFLEQILKDIHFKTVVDGFCMRGHEICKKLVLQFGNKNAKKDLEASVQVIVGLLDLCTHIDIYYPANVTRERACKIGIEMIIAYFK